MFLFLDGNRQVQEYTDEQIFTTVYEQGSFEPVARIVQLASHIEQKRLAEIAYETRRFVRIGESEETINQRIADNSKPLINIYHYHCNHLGTPQELTNQDGDVIWLSYDRAWGGSFDTIYKQQFIDNFAISENELQPIKFQGQSLDTETGLHYNRFRYYDSDVGMFISRDPIGLMGGSNVFQYAPNPIGWIDPWGLECTHTAKNPKQLFASIIDKWRGTKWFTHLDGKDMKEIQATIDRIKSQSPRYSNDSTPFKNSHDHVGGNPNSQRLDTGSGPYTEWTVKTPNEKGNGARRIVVDKKTGDAFYSHDHYDSFIKIDLSGWK